MKLSETSLISAPPEKIWPFIVTPEHFQIWNDKIVSIEAKGTFILGQPYITHYKLTKESSQFMSTVTRLEPNQLLEIHHVTVVSSRGHSDMEATERITLIPCGDKTKVRKDVWIKNHDVPLILRPLIWFIMTCGKRKGEDKLKSLVEKSI